MSGIFLNMLDVAGTQQKTEHICAVRLATTMWRDSRGIHLKKSLNFLKRKRKGYNILDEDCSMGGTEEAMLRITNINSVEDGVYKVVTHNEQTDWESGVVDDYDYKLVAM